MQNRYKSLLKRAGVPYRNFHALRHTYATRCIEQNVDVKSVSEMLGHSDVRITLQTYVHVLLGKHADTGNVVRNQTAHAGDSAVLTSMYSAMRRS